MHDTAGFFSPQSARGLFNYVQRKCKRHGSVTAYTRFERFALDQFHRVETLAILFAVICHPSHIWMTNVRRRTRFAQKTGPRAGVLCNLAIDDFESNKRVQNCIARAVSYRHRSSTEFNRKPICPSLYFKVGVSQCSRRQPAARRWSFRLLALPPEGKTNKTPQAFAVRTTLSQRSPAGRAGLFSFILRFRRSETNIDVVHVGKAASGHQYLVQMAQFSIDVCRIRDCTADFCSQRFTESLAEPRKPCSQSRNWHSKSSCSFLLTGRPGAAASHERPQFLEPLSFAFRFKFVLQIFPRP